MTIGAIHRRTKGQTAERRRETGDLYGPTAPVATIVQTISRTEVFFVEVRIAGMSDGTGIVTITGTDAASAAQSVVITVSGNGRYLAVGDTQDFLTITNIATSGLADEGTVGTILVRAVSESGQQLVADTVLGTFPVYNARPRIGELLQSSGNVPLNSTTFITFGNSIVEENDLLVISGQVWEVKAVVDYNDRNGEEGYRQIIAFAQGQN